MLSILRASSESKPFLSVYHEIMRHLQEGDNKINLVAVTKGQPFPVFSPLLEVGHRHFGENRVQEALAKWGLLKDQYDDINLHLIGPLQRNKVAQALKLFHTIQTIDRPTLVDEIAKELAKTPERGRGPTLYLQVNVGREPQKAGVLPENLEGLLHYAHEKNLCIQGLMCIPPSQEDPEPYFLQMQKWATHYQLPFLSMGMSNDYLKALPYGATHVRLGTALFGKRLLEK